MSTPGLQIDRLSISAGDVALVEDVSLSVKPGHILGLVGESGSGKSLTVMTAGGLIPKGCHVASGQVVLNGKRLVGPGYVAPREECAKDIGIVFQDPFTSLNPVRPVGSVLQKVLCNVHGYGAAAARQKSIEALVAVGMPQPEVKIDAYPHQLSGGQRQRVVIALALLANPSLMIADEPTTALDPSVQRQILDLIRNVTAQTAAIFVTHDFGAAAYLCDDIAVMYGGRIVEAAPTDVILRHARHPYSQALIACAPSLTQRELVAIAGHPVSPADRPAGCAFAPRCAHASRQCADQPQLAELAPGHGVACFHPQEALATA